MPEISSPAYGTTRERGRNVSHAEVERAAFDILGSGRRPSVVSVRQALGRGSPATIAASLKRFWRDLGARTQGDPAALTRLPSDIADLADGMWQRALALATQAAKHDDNGARERLAQIHLENELRAQSFALREKEFETASRARERALSDSREHLSSTLKMLEADRVTLRAREARIADLEIQVEEYRRQLTTVIGRAVARNRTLTDRKTRPAARRDLKARSTRRGALKSRLRNTLKNKRVSKRQ